MAEQPTALAARRYRIHGRVQGVGYRAFIWRLASALRLAGWARNRLDGSVEAVLQGRIEAIDRAMTQLQNGPPMARVDRIEVADEPDADLHGFEVRPTE